MNQRAKIFFENLVALLPTFESLPEIDKRVVLSIVPDDNDVFNTIAILGDEGRRAKAKEGAATANALAEGGRASAKCRSCGAPIVFMATFSGKKIPVDVASFDGAEVFDRRKHVSHFSTCPNADEHRRPRG